MRTATTQDYGQIRFVDVVPIVCFFLEHELNAALGRAGPAI